MSNYMSNTKSMHTYTPIKTKEPLIFKRTETCLQTNTKT